MTIPTITPAPDAPIRSNYSSDDAYSAAVGAWMAWWEDNPAELNASFAAVDAAVADAEQAVIAAQAAATATTLGTSTTAVTIGTGSKGPFATQSGKNWAEGSWLTLTSDADPTKWMFGYVTAYSGTSLTVMVTATNGAGSVSDWVIALAGPRGLAGADGSDGANGSGPWAQIGSTITTTGVSSVSFTSIPNDRDDLRIEFGGLSTSTTADIRIEFSPDGSTWSSPAAIKSAADAADTYYGQIPIIGYAGPAPTAFLGVAERSSNNSAQFVPGNFAIAIRMSAGVQAIRISVSTGTMDATNLKLFGRTPAP